MDRKADERLLGMIFDAATADGPLLASLIIGLVEEGLISPAAIKTIFLRARTIISDLPENELHGQALDAVASRVRSRLAELGHGNIPSPTPPEWWKG